MPPRILLDKVTASDVLRGFLATDFYKTNNTVKGAPKLTYYMEPLGSTYSFNPSDRKTIKGATFVAMPSAGSTSSREPTSANQVGLCTQWFKYLSGPSPADANEIYREVAIDIVMSWATALAGGSLSSSGLGDIGMSLYDLAGADEDRRSAGDMLDKFNKAWTAGMARSIQSITDAAEKRVAEKILALWTSTDAGVCRFTYEIAGWDPRDPPSVMLPPRRAANQAAPLWVDTSVWASEYWNPGLGQSAEQAAKAKTSALETVHKILYGGASHQHNVNYSLAEIYDNFTTRRMRLSLVTKPRFIISDLKFFAWLAEDVKFT